MSSSPATVAPPEITNSPMQTTRHSPSNSGKSNSSSSLQRVNQRVLTPVVVCGSPCVLPTPKEGLLSPLLTAAAASAAAAANNNNNNNKASSPSVLIQNNVPASESEKLTATNIYVLRELERPRPRPSDIESTVCPSGVESFRKAWWAGVRPTTCERTCRHRSKVCDAIQLCNDCTGYYCKWLAELVGIPVLKASGRVDPVIFEKDKLAKLYWERISKVACCPKVTAKCLMCIRRYQLFTHFLPGNLDFRTLVHESVMKLHEEGFAVDMGLIRKVTRRHLECIADHMGLCLPVEYMSSYQAYDIIVRRGPLVDVLANGLSSALQQQQQQQPQGQASPAAPGSRLLLNARGSNYSPSSSSSSSLRHNAEQLMKQNSSPLKDATSSTSGSLGGSSPKEFSRIELNEPDYRDDEDQTTRLRRKMRRNFNGPVKEEEAVGKRRSSRRQIRRRRPIYAGEEIYYGEENDFFSILDDPEQVDQPESEDSEGQSRRRKKKQRTTTARTQTGLPPSGLLGFGLDEQFPPMDGRTIRNDNSSICRSFDALVDQYRSSLDGEVSIDTETIQMPSRKEGSGLSAPGLARQQKTRSSMNYGNLSDVKFDNQSGFDYSNSSAIVDRLASAVLQRFDHRLKSRSEPTVTDGVHRRQLAEEGRLGESGVRGVFWDPSKEGWCALLPLSPSAADEGLSTMKRKILCFAASSWKSSESLESAKWSAVYERLRRNPRELECLSRDVREDLSNWVRDNIELSALESASEEYKEGNCTGAAQPCNGINQGDLDLNQIDATTASALINGLVGSNQVSAGNLTELLGSLAKQIAAIGSNTNELRPPQQDTTTGTTTTTGAGVDSLDVSLTTSTGAAASSGEDQQGLSDERHPSSTIMGILATLQSKLPSADQSQPSVNLSLLSQQVKPEEDQ